ncbi:MAG: histidine phosphatase family protein [Candidatus Woesearchaeota archaeon]
MSIVYVIRHAEKSQDGGLTIQGTREALDYGRMLAEQYQGFKIIANSSEIERATLTAELIMEGAGTKYNRSDTLDEKLFLGYTSEEIEAIKASKEKTLYQKAVDAVPEKTEERAQDISKYVLEHLANDEYTVYVGVTHSPIIEAYAKRLTDDKKAEQDPGSLQGIIVEDNKAELKYAGIEAELTNNEDENEETANNENNYNCIQENYQTEQQESEGAQE